MCEIDEHNHLILEAGSTKRLKGNAANNHRLGRHTWSIHSRHHDANFQLQEFLLYFGSLTECALGSYKKITLKILEWVPGLQDYVLYKYRKINRVSNFWDTLHDVQICFTS